LTSTPNNLIGHVKAHYQNIIFKYDGESTVDDTLGTEKFYKFEIDGDNWVITYNLNAWNKKPANPGVKFETIMSMFTPRAIVECNSKVPALQKDFSTAIGKKVHLEVDFAYFVDHPNWINGFEKLKDQEAAIKKLWAGFLPKLLSMPESIGALIKEEKKLKPLITAEEQEQAKERINSVVFRFDPENSIKSDDPQCDFYVLYFTGDILNCAVNQDKWSSALKNIPKALSAALAYDVPTGTPAASLPQSEPEAQQTQVDSLGQPIQQMKAKVYRNYFAQKPDEISMTGGDIMIIEKDWSGRYFGYKEGTSSKGWFPVSTCEVINQ